MQNKFVTIKGVEYIRQVEMIGDVEKITFYTITPTDEDSNLDILTEVYDKDFANELEFLYELQCTAEFTPQLFYI